MNAVVVHGSYLMFNWSDYEAEIRVLDVFSRCFRSTCTLQLMVYDGLLLTVP